MKNFLRGKCTTGDKFTFSTKKHYLRVGNLRQCSRFCEKTPRGLVANKMGGGVGFGKQLAGELSESRKTSEDFPASRLTPHPLPPLSQFRANLGIC